MIFSLFLPLPVKPPTVTHLAATSLTSADRDMSKTAAKFKIEYVSHIITSKTASKTFTVSTN
jgi:hypothetical protein